MRADCPLPKYRAAPIAKPIEVHHASCSLYRRISLTDHLWSREVLADTNQGQLLIIRLINRCRRRHRYRLHHRRRWCCCCCGFLLINLFTKCFSLSSVQRPFGQRFERKNERTSVSGLQLPSPRAPDPFPRAQQNNELN